MNSYQNFNLGHFKPFSHSQTNFCFTLILLKAFTISYRQAASWYQLNNFKTMPLGCVGISRTNEEADGFIKLLTQDQVEQELITWD